MQMSCRLTGKHPSETATRSISSCAFVGLGITTAAIQVRYCSVTKATLNSQGITTYRIKLFHLEQL